MHHAFLSSEPKSFSGLYGKDYGCGFFVKAITHINLPTQCVLHTAENGALLLKL